eukprot:TRINITY_DN27041_c0_g1_i2.p1 TRINITY_DN27041_c0_g1~~TRINITY_DN27041_c0_g1_i2.p1  ORF type:complete len:574 (+),score=114.50 TRINITY_DN27041_c0_g1_i2:30-1751(+)
MAATAATAAGPSTPRRFSPWLCLVAPDAAADEKVAEPYAVLEITLDRARGLAAADANGLSDPYVSLLLNNQDLGLRTKSCSCTLAPVWQTSFKIPVYRPHSVLTLAIHDEDFGTGKELGLAGSILGLSDDLIGYVDISLIRLQPNKVISGWFSVLEPSGHLDNVSARLDAYGKGVRPRLSGEIALELTLHVTKPSHEFFACCLGPPCLGQPLPELDLESLFSDILALTKRLEAERCSSALWGTAILLLWHPEYLLPLLLIALAALLAAGFAIPGASQQQQQLQGGSAAAAGEEFTREQQQPGTCVDADSEAARAVSDPGLVKMLKAAKGVIPAQDSTDIRLFQSNLGLILSQFRTVEESWRSTLVLRIPAAAGLSLACALLVAFRDWQAFLIRLVLTGIFLVLLLQQSCVARLLAALLRYLQSERGKLNVETESSGFADAETPSEASDNEDEVSAREASQKLRKRNARRGTTIEGDLLFQATQSLVKLKPRKEHVLKWETLAEPKWCNYCGGFLWGIWRQGMTCANCPLTLCADCSDQRHGKCPGQVEEVFEGVSPGKEEREQCCGRPPARGE